MKSPSTCLLMLAAALAACAPAQRAAAPAAPQESRPGAGEQQGISAQPGAQSSQAQMVALAAAMAGPAQGLGLPGAAAAQAGGQPDLQAGRQLATAGAPNGVAACVTCHGAQGEGDAAGGFPRIAGQPRYYLGKQLAAYANEARVNPVMGPIAKAMTAHQIRDVSAYYATLGGAPARAAAAPAGPGAARALQLATAGDNAKQVQACANCHGPGGAGEPPVSPYLAGQHASYLTAAMGQWKSGARKTDMSGQMPHIARALSDADVAALSAWFSAQPPPVLAAAQMVNIPAGSTLRPAVSAARGGPRGPAAAGVAGSGSEQGAPVTGGSQGPGGGGGTQGTQPPPPAGR